MAAILGRWEAQRGPTPRRHLPEVLTSYQDRDGAPSGGADFIPRQGVGFSAWKTLSHFLCDTTYFLERSFPAF